MTVLRYAVEAVMTQVGALTASIVDVESGECLERSGTAASGALEAAALVNARMLRAKLRMVEDHYHESVEDILITLDRHYHLIRLIHNRTEAPHLFMYLVLDRQTANLVMARRKLAEIEGDMISEPDADDILEAARIRALSLGCVSNKLFGRNGKFLVEESDEELPPFMREDVAMKILGISAEEEYRDV